MPKRCANLLSLVDLAKEASSERRRELLREVTDLFLADANDCSEAERDHFGAILGVLAKEMELAVREHLARALASLPTAPHLLVHQLANDEFSVAQEIIAQSPVLKDQDLVEIVEKKGQDYLEVIATRPTVSPVVSEALVNKGNDGVLTKLTSNSGAILSHSTMKRAVERSKNNEEIQKSLISREDLPPGLLNEIFSVASTQLRTQIAKKLEGMPQNMLDAALSNTLARFAREMREIKQAERSAQTFVSAIAQDDKLSEDLLIRLMREGRMNEFFHAFARLTGIDIGSAKRLVQTKNVEGIAIICKASRFDRATYSALALALEPSQTDSASGAPAAQAKSTEVLLQLYDQMTAEAAQRVVRFWKVRRDASRPVSAESRA